MCSIFKYGSTVGRNFDYEKSYREQITIIPSQQYNNKYAIMGVCTGAVCDYPLLYDGMNQCGLVCGGLAFTNNAIYNPPKDNKVNIPSYDFVFKVLSNYQTVDELKNDVENINITDENYSDDLRSTDLHWFVCDMQESIIVEQTKDGLHFYEGDVMTNNPPYNEQMSYYIGDKFIGKFHPVLSHLKETEWYSRGRETDGLSGGYSSNERFERLSYVLDKIIKSNSPFDEITETFHLLSSVEQPYGVTTIDKMYEYTIYSVVYDMTNLKMWIKTYNKLCPINCVLTNELERVDI